MRLMRRNLAPYLSLPADQFTKADLRAARDAMVEADAMIAGNRLLQRLGPVMKWAAQEDLIPVNFVPDIRKAPETEAHPQAERCGDQGDLESLRRGSRQPRGGEELRPHGALPAGDGAAPRRGGSLRHGHILDGVWRQTDNKSSRPHSLKLPPLALDLVGQGAPATTCSQGSVGKISGFSKLKTALDEAAASPTGGCTI